MFSVDSMNGRYSDYEELRPTGDASHILDTKVVVYTFKFTMAVSGIEYLSTLETTVVLLEYLVRGRDTAHSMSAPQRSCRALDLQRQTLFQLR